MVTQNQNQKLYEVKVNKIVFLGNKNYWRKYVTLVNSEENINKFYQVTLMVHRDGSLKFKCNCIAGKHGLMCKHVLKFYNKLLRNNFKADVNLSNQ